MFRFWGFGLLSSGLLSFGSHQAHTSTPGCFELFSPGHMAIDPWPEPIDDSMNPLEAFIVARPGNMGNGDPLDEGQDLRTGLWRDQLEFMRSHDTRNDILPGWDPPPRGNWVRNSNGGPWVYIRAEGEPPAIPVTGSRYWMPSDDEDDGDGDDDDNHDDEEDHFIIDYMTHLGTTLQEADYDLGFRVEGLLMV